MLRSVSVTGSDLVCYYTLLDGWGRRRGESIRSIVLKCRKLSLASFRPNYYLPSTTSQQYFPVMDRRKGRV